MVSPLRTEGFLMDAWPTPPFAKELAPGLNWRRLREICTWLLAVWPGSLFGDYDFVLVSDLGFRASNFDPRLRGLCLRRLSITPDSNPNQEGQY